MRFRRILLAAMLVAIVPAMIFGTGSFSSVSAERGLAVDTVGDSDAYMALKYSDDDLELSGSDRYPAREFLTIGNNFGGDIDASLTSVGVSAPDSLSVAPESVDAEYIESGNELVVDTEITCHSPGEYSATISFDAMVNGDNNNVHAHTTAEREVTFDVQCKSVIVDTANNPQGTENGSAFTLLELTDVSNQSATLDDVSVPSSAPVNIVSSSIDGSVEAKCTDSTGGTDKQVTVTIDGSGDAISFTREETVSVSCESDDSQSGGEGNSQ